MSRCLTIAAFASQRDAESLCGELRCQGVEASVVDESVAVGDGARWMRVFQVQVPRSAFEQAGGVLAEEDEAPPRRQFHQRAAFLAVAVACVSAALILKFGLLASLFGTAFVLFGIVAIVAGAVTTHRGRASWGWSSVRGRITRAYIEKSGDRQESDYKARINYRFQLGGCDYAADTVHFFAKTRSGTQSNYEIERKEIMRFPAGLEVEVFYDPARPAIAVLERGARIIDAAVFCVFGLMLIGVGIACFAWIETG